MIFSFISFGTGVYALLTKVAFGLLSTSFFHVCGLFSCRITHCFFKVLCCQAKFLRLFPSIRVTTSLNTFKQKCTRLLMCNVPGAFSLIRWVKCVNARQGSNQQQVRCNALYQDKLSYFKAAARTVNIIHTFTLIIHGLSNLETCI